MTLTREVYGALTDIVGADNIAEDPAILDAYSYQWGATSLTGKPFALRYQAILLPSSTLEVQAIVKLCNKYKVEYKAFSTGWGHFNAPKTENVILLDLKRMNKILEINEENMYAVVEPYVIFAKLQAELMKRGLNCNITGAGSNCSAHPFAAHAGIGQMGETTSCRERNILATEWVTPEGEIVRLGSLGSMNEWFCGDGPGPSIRGIIMGAMAPQGGIGIFTKAATKVYHWGGPSVFPIEGVSPDYTPKQIPDNMFYRYYSFPSKEMMIEAQRKIGESEIAFEVMGFSTAMLASNAARNNDEDSAYFKLFHKLVQGPGFQVILVGHSPEDFAYKKEVLEQIIAETNGKSLEPLEDPTLAGGLMWRSIRVTGSIRECFRGSREGIGILGGTHPYAEEVRYLEELAKLKKDLIKRGLARDDGGAYLTWSMEHGHLGHAEMLLYYHSTPEALKAVGQLMQKTVETAIDIKYGVPQQVSGKSHDKIGPYASNYHLWMKKIKKAFDPNGLSDALKYITSE